VYARTWRIHVGTAADQWRFTVWFFVTSLAIALMTVMAAQLRAAGWLAALPAWIGGSMLFWLWTPRFVLHGKVAYRALLPGALLATFVVGGTVATSPLWIGPTLNQNAAAFGAFGVVIGLLAYVLIGVTISMVCVVFGPVWAEWRRSERELEPVGDVHR
jgi:membrane protein